MISKVREPNALVSLLFGSSMILLAAAVAGGDTLVSGVISTNTTWTLAGSPYIVTGGIQVHGAPTPVLTIQAGVTVKFNQNTYLSVSDGFGPGGIQAIGTSAQRITFTANTASPTPGFWLGISLNSGTLSNSRIAYATISYGGSEGYSAGGLHLASSATIDNTTVQNSAYAGITIIGSVSPSVVSSTVTANPIGVMTWYPAAPSLQTVTISSNTGFAVSQDARQTLGTVSGLTLTGNGTNAIELRGGTLGVNTTWKATSHPYVVASAIQVYGTPTPVLTIQAGVTVKFNQNTHLAVGYTGPGRIQAVGTSAQRITFTANTASPTPGFWLGIYLYSGTLSSSKIAYANVSYGGSEGYSGGGIHVGGSSPAIDNVTLQSNAYAGISLNLGSPTISNASFLSNTVGIANAVPANIVSARLSFWGHASGPSGSGPGTGQWISAGVRFEPWLLAAPSSPQSFTSSTHTNRTFNPSLSINTTISAGTAQSGTWTVKIINSGSVVVRTFTGSGTSATSIWDGKNVQGANQPDGTYSYQLESVAGANTATPAKGLTILNRTTQLTLTNLGVSPLFFSPNADSIQDTTTVSATNPFDGTNFTVNVRNSAGTIVRTSTSQGATLAYTWNGKNASNVTQPDGVYTFEIIASNGTASATSSPTGTLDRTLPVATIAYPGTQVLSNVYQSGSADIAIRGTATDLNLANWLLDYTAPAVGDLQWGTTPVSNGTLYLWSTLALTNVQYGLRLQVWDKAGNRRESLVNPTVANFKASQNVYEMNPAAGNTISYTSTVPFSLTETLSLKNASGTVVRTLVSAVRPAGTYIDVWNGRNGGGVLVPDGPYFYICTLTAGASSMTWNLANEFVNYYGSYGFTSNAPADPFNNSPVNISYDFSFPGRIWIAFSPIDDSEMPAGCPPPTFCIVNAEYQESGARTVQWAGIDPTGRFRGDVRRATVVKDQSQFSKNAVVVFGTRPTLANVRVSPAAYAPTRGPQGVSFDLATHQNQPVTATITFLNQESLSVLRTITLVNQAPGAVSTTWDGRADNGMWVAPGIYTVTVKVTDSLGNTASGQILTTIGY